MTNKNDIKIEQVKTVYVLCPGGLRTGGPELLHQLVQSLNIIGKPANIVYTGKDVGVVDDYKKYIQNYTYDLNSIEDDKDNLLIVSETQIEYLRPFKCIRKAIWWLSVDNYLRKIDFRVRADVSGIGSAIYRLLDGTFRKNVATCEIKEADFHLAQSYYAFLYITGEYGICDDKVVFLSDYINTYYTKDYRGVDKGEKEDIVLYNPKKGYKFTRKLMKRMPDIKWIAIENMTQQQVYSLLHKSKCYIDFGNHPGKDRFPREAAICGCVVITGKRGAASNSFDVRIPEIYKFDEKTDSISDIELCIRTCVKEYSSIIDQFEEYRMLILDEERKFNEDVEKIFM